MELVKKGLLFAVGGGGYVGLEYFWRGRSHPTMFVLGGLCFTLLGQLRTLRPGLRPLAGTTICTTGELVFGLLFNRDFRIWDYRSLPLNLWGQVCLIYSLLWAVLTIPAVGLYAVLDQGLSK